MILFPVDARGFCREVNVAPPAGYDPATTGCFYPTTNPQTGGRVVELYWKSLCVGYSLQKNASRQVTLDQATRLAGQAFAAWGGAACSAGGSPSIDAVDQGPVACGAVQYNDAGANQHVIVFRDDAWPYQDSSNVLGLTTLTVSNATGEIYDADMEINSHDFALTVDGTPGMVDAGSESFDLLGIMTHEAGHFLGLAHSTDMTAIMYARYSPGPGPLTDDDVMGICSIDVPGGTRSTSSGIIKATACDPTPMNGFSTQCGGLNSDGGTGTVSSPAVSCPPPKRGCSIGRGGFSADAGLPLLGLAGLGVLARRRLRRLRPVATAIGVFLTTLGASALGTSNAQASVSIAMLFEELASGASGVAVVTPVEQHASWENGRIFTHTRVRVDSVVAGQLPTSLSVRTLGGSVGDIGQIVEGEAMFALGQRSLLFLRPRIDPASSVPSDDFVVAARAQGQFLIVIGEDKKPRLQAAGAGALLPPSAARLARIAELHPLTKAPRLARDVLHQRLVDDAIRDITAAWTRCHGSQ